jgi:hypothetical protein
VPDELGRRALPREASEELSYDGLIATLRQLVGEDVCLAMTLGDGGSRLTVQGVLSLYDYGWATGAAIGTARLLLSPETATETTLRTLDGNDFFIISLRFGNIALTIGDPGTLGTDEFN